MKNSDRTILVWEELDSIVESSIEICKIAQAENDIITCQIMAAIGLTVRILSKTISTAISEASPKKLQELGEILSTFSKTLPTNSELLTSIDERIKQCGIKAD